MRNDVWLVLLAIALLGMGAASAGPDADQAAGHGYMIVISQDVNPAAMSAYAKVAVPLLFEYGAKLLFVTEENNNEVLEGGPFPQSIRVFQFPSIQAARDYYHSDEYQRATPMRAGNGKIDVILADRFVPDPKWSS